MFDRFERKREGLAPKVRREGPRLQRPGQAPFRRLGSAVLICLVLAYGAAGEDEPAAGEAQGQSEEAAKKNQRPWIRGSFHAAVDARWYDGDSDLDFDQTLRLQVDPPQHQRLHLRGTLWMNEDLDGDERRNGVLRGINDASSSDVRARLMNLYLDVDDLWGDSVLRVGRQRILEGVAYNRIDGLYFRQRAGKWNWYGFGGARASVYGDTHDDLVLGGGVAYQPSYRTRLSLDTYYGEEHRSSRDAVRLDPVAYFFGFRFPRRVKKDIDETAVGLSIWHDFTPNIRGYGRYLWKDGEGDELMMSVTGFVSTWDLSYEVVYTTQLNSAGDQVSDLTSFFRILGEYEPYHNVVVALYRPLTEKIMLSFEAEINNAKHDDPLTANRDYQRYAAILSVDELAPGVDASVALEHWSVSGGEDQFAVTGEVSKAWNKMRVTLGADFERYEDWFVRYNPVPYALDQLWVLLQPDIFQGFNPLVWLLDTTVVETHENVYSAYGKLRWDIREDQQVTVRITFQEDTGSDSPYWRVRAGYTIRF